MSTTLLIAHTFASTKVTSSDPTLVSAGQWNLSSAHTVTGTLESSNISGTLTSSQIVSIGSSQITGTLTSSQIVSIGSSQITGTFTSSQIVSIGSSQITGTLPSSQGGTGATSLGTNANMLYNNAGVVAGASNWLWLSSNAQMTAASMYVQTDVALTLHSGLGGI